MYTLAPPPPIAGPLLPKSSLCSEARIAPQSRLTAENTGSTTRSHCSRIDCSNGLMNENLRVNVKNVHLPLASEGQRPPRYTPLSALPAETNIGIRMKPAERWKSVEGWLSVRSTASRSSPILPKTLSYNSSGSMDDRDSRGYSTGISSVQEKSLFPSLRLRRATDQISQHPARSPQLSQR